MKLTPHEEKILKLLEQYPDIKNDPQLRREVAEKHGLTEKTVRNRIADLKKYGLVPEEVTATPSQVKHPQYSLWDLIYRLSKRKWALMRFVLGTGILSALLSLIIPQTYSSTASLLPPEWTEGSKLNMNQFLSGGFLTAFGVEGDFTDSRIVTAFLNSVRLRKQIIEHFNLQAKYETEDLEQTLEALNQYIYYALNEDGTISLTFSGKTGWLPDQEEIDSVRHAVAEINSYLLERLDALYQEILTKRAVKLRNFYEERYKDTKAEIAKLEASIVAFERRYGIVDVENQLQSAIRLIEAQVTSSIEVMTQLQIQRLSQEVQYEYLRSTLSEKSPEVQDAKVLLDEFDQQIDSLRVSAGQIDTTLVKKLFPFYEKTPELAIQWFRYQRDLRIQNEILSIILKQYEEHKIKALRNIPKIQLLDLPRVPIHKSRPRRMLMVLITMVFFGFTFVVKEGFNIYFNRLQVENPGEYQKVVQIKRALMRFKRV